MKDSLWESVDSECQVGVLRPMAGIACPMRTQPLNKQHLFGEGARVVVRTGALEWPKFRAEGSGFSYGKTHECKAAQAKTQQKHPKQNNQYLQLY